MFIQRSDGCMYWNGIRVTADPRVPPGCVVLDLARRGGITQEGARQFLEMPTVELRPPVDPLEVEYEGVSLRVLLHRDRFNRREYAELDGSDATPFAFSTAQRAAVSAHWSAQLRARVEASRERDRQRVVLDLDED